MLSRLSAVAGALIFSQLPQYLQQYTQRLGGHVNEIGRLVEQLQMLALQSGKSLSQYIDKFTRSNDPDFAQQGEWMQTLVERHAQLSAAWEAITHATPLTRLSAYLAHHQSEIAKTTLAFFQPAFPMTVEAGIYALIGALIGYLIYRCIKFLILNIYKKISRSVNSRSLSADN